LSFLVIIHELGHFLVARKNNIGVEEFGMGYPPKALTIKKDAQGTEWTINWLPFGGFVRLYGEDGVGESRGGRAFFEKSVRVRLMVVAAGAVVNFLFGALAFGGIYTAVGIPTQYAYVKIDEVSPGSPADKAGIKAGDAFDGVGVNGQITKVTNINDFIKAVSSYRGQVVSLKRQDKPELVPVYVRPEKETPDGQGALGVVVTDFEMKHFPVWQMPFRGIAYGTKTAVDFGILLYKALGDMVGQLVKGHVPQDVAGPVGIAYMAQKQGILTGGILEVVNFAAILSINLAIVNILPIPALDGGRAAFLIIEGLTKKKVKPEIEQKVNAVGFAALVMLLILISVKDIRTVAGDQGIQAWFKSIFRQ
jgi:regulator of sigma E protease